MTRKAEPAQILREFLAVTGDVLDGTWAPLS